MANHSTKTPSPSPTHPGWIRILFPSHKYNQFKKTGLPAIDQHAIDLSCQAMATGDYGFANGILLCVAFATTEADYPHLTFSEVELLLKAITHHATEIKPPVMNNLPIAMAGWVRGRSRSPRSEQYMLSKRIGLMSPRAVAAIFMRCVIYEEYFKRLKYSPNGTEEQEYAAFFGVDRKLTDMSVPF